METFHDRVAQFFSWIRIRSIKTWIRIRFAVRGWYRIQFVVRGWIRIWSMDRPDPKPWGGGGLFILWNLKNITNSASTACTMRSICSHLNIEIVTYIDATHLKKFCTFECLAYTNVMHMQPFHIQMFERYMTIMNLVPWPCCIL